MINGGSGSTHYAKDEDKMVATVPAEADSE